MLTVDDGGLEMLKVADGVDGQYVNRPVANC